MEKEKLINMSEHCWHYKLIKFVWNFEPKEFKSLCPYFWVTISSLFAFPVAAIWKFIKFIGKSIYNGLDYLSSKLTAWADDNKYTNMVVKISPFDVYFLNHKDSDLFKAAREIAHFRILENYFRTHPNLLKDTKVKECSQSEFKNHLTKTIKYLAHLEELRVKKEESAEEARKRRKRMMNNIAGITKNISLFLNLCAIVLVIFAIVTLVTYGLLYALLYVTVDWAAALIIFLKLIAIIGVAILIALFAGYGVKLHEQDEEKTIYQKILYILWYPIYLVLIKLITEYFLYYFIVKFIGCTIIGGIYQGFKVGFKEFGGIFSDYLNASYSDYCPGINWEE